MKKYIQRFYSVKLLRVQRDYDVDMKKMADDLVYARY